MYEDEIHLDEGDPVPDGYIVAGGHVVPIKPKGKRFTKARRDSFVRALARSGSEVTACLLIGITPTVVKAYRKTDGAFDEACLMADQIFSSTVLEQELFRRAVNGVQEEVYFGGKVVGHKTNYSDTLLLAALKKRDPGYRNDGPGLAVNVNTGVLVVPSDAPSMDSWIEENEDDIS